ncbi:MAG: GAF domain-containing protein [Bacteroidales bacterium]
MIWIKTEVYQAVVAWIFMLFAGILLLSSFGENGEATSRTYFYLLLILMLGLFLFITVMKRHTNNAWKEQDESGSIDEEEELSPGPLQFSGEVDLDDYDPDIEEFADQIVSDGHNGESAGKVPERLLRSVAKRLDAVQGILYAKDTDAGTYRRIADYAFYSETEPPAFKPGETLPGQVAKNKNLLIIDVPEGYMTILSGLGSSHPRYLMIVPFVYEGEAVAIAELASFRPFTEKEQKFMEQLSNGGNEIVKSLKAG